MSADPKTVTFETTVAATGNNTGIVVLGKLSNSMQRYHVDQVNAVKSAGTRQRRIEGAVALLLEGKQR